MSTGLRSRYLLSCIVVLGLVSQRAEAGTKSPTRTSSPHQFADLPPPPPSLDSLAPQEADNIPEVQEPAADISSPLSETQTVASTNTKAAPTTSPSKPEDRPHRFYHEVIPYERLDEIAERYGVSKKSLLLWNKSSLDAKNPRLRAGQKLRIYAVRPPPPKREIVYEVRKGDSWTKIAKKFAVDVDRLKKWNRSTSQSLRRGSKLRLWIEAPPAPQDPSPADLAAYNDLSPVTNETQAILTASLAAIHVRQNGYSVGRTNRGKLVNGVQLPENPQLYWRRKPEESWGSSHTIEQMLRAIVSFHYQSGYTRPLTIGAISRRGGGRLPPHSSHQSGRDVDIRLPKKPSVHHKNPPKPHEIDWRAAWRLVQSFLATHEVEYIFLDHRLQKQLHQAALADGMNKQELEKLIQWPNPAKTNHGMVRHSSGHTSHIHIRIKCGPRETRCASK